jgi:SAM-dependent methyltransferase
MFYTRGMFVTESSASHAYDGIAALYDGMIAHYRELNPSFDDDIPFYKSFATDPKHNRYMEIGCGTGRVLFPFLEEGYMMTGVDISGGMLEILRKRTLEYITAGQLIVKNHNFSVGPLGNQVDGAFVTSDTFNYVPLTERTKFLTNTVASLRTDAVIAFDVFTPQSMTSPAIQDRWIEKGTFAADGKLITLRDTRKMVTDVCERRTQVFVEENGHKTEVSTDKYYVSPTNLIALAEETGIGNIRMFTRDNIQTPQDIATCIPTGNFFVVGYKK